MMDTLETFVGWVPGFYTLAIFTTVYLMLPMFRGADKVFRKILVPLAGKLWINRVGSGKPFSPPILFIVNSTASSADRAPRATYIA